MTNEQVIYKLINKISDRNDDAECTIALYFYYSFQDSNISYIYLAYVKLMYLKMINGLNKSENHNLKMT